MRRAAVATVAVLGAAALASSDGCTRSWDLGGNPTDGPVTSDGSSDGQTGGGFGTGGRPGMGGPGGGGRPGSGCNMDRVPADLHVADVLISVGRDASMSSRFGDTTRMSAVQSAVHQLITTNQKAVNWGYQDVPALTGCADAACCCVAPSPINPTPFSFAAADQAAQKCPGGICTSQGDSRPIAEALSGALSLFNSLSRQGEMTDRYVVLIVDGTPGCVGADAGQACSSAVQATSMLARSSVQTYVVALGDDATKDPCLQMIAIMGGLQPYIFQVSDQSADPNLLPKTLSLILSLITAPSCTIDLQSPPTDPTKISLYLGGTQIPYDPSNMDGWSFAQQSRVQIKVYGSSCRMVQTHPADIVVDLGCTPCGQHFHSL